MDRRSFNNYLLLSILSSSLFGEDKSKIILNDSNVSLFNNLKKIKKYYITIDDGYHYVKEILAVANEKNVKLNLFIIGSIIEENPKIWIEAIEQGHLLGSHTYNHYQFSKHSYKDIKKDFKQYENIMKDKIGLEHYNNIKFFRFPYGDKGNIHNKKDIHKLITQDYGWETVDWDLDLSFNHKDHRCRSFTLDEQKDCYSSYCSKSIKPKNIVLFHFKKPDNICLDDFITFGLKHDLEFLRLDHK